MNTYTVIADARNPIGNVRAVVINSIQAHSEDQALANANRRIRELGGQVVGLRKVRRTDVEPRAAA